LDLAGFDPGVEESDLSGDAVLFGLEQVQRYGSGVVGLEQLGALVVEAVAFEDRCFAFGVGGGAASVELAGDQLTYRCDEVGGYLHAAVVVLDWGLHVGHEHGLAVAVGAIGVSAGADEVGVDHSAAAAGVGQDQSGAAGAAEHGAFEVVLVGLGLLAGGLVGVEDRLDPVTD